MGAHVILGRHAGLRRSIAIVLVTLLALVGASCGADAVTDSGAPRVSTTPGSSSGATAPLPARGSVPGSAVAGTSTSTNVSTTASTTTTTTTVVAARPSSTPAPPISSPAPPVARDLAVSTTTVALVDASRPTVSRGRQLAASRTLTTTLMFPTAGGPYPMIVFAHGFQLGPSHYERIMRAIAAGGYVVAAPSFPLADAAVGGADIDRGDIPNQSGDLRFVIDELTGSRAPAALAGKIDAGRIGAAGHSDGADTVLDLGYYPGRMDVRVKAVAALSPDAMTGPGGSVGSAPLLLTHGDRDTIVPISNSRTVFNQVRARRYFVTLLGGDHLAPVQGAAPWAVPLDRAVLDLFDHVVAGRTADDRALLANAAVPGVTSVQPAG